MTNDVSKLFSLEQELFKKENFPLSYTSFYYHIKNNLLYVAEVDKKIVAYILVLIKRKKAKIYSIGVSNQFRGQKISSKLLATALVKLKKLSFKRVVLEVRVDNNNAIELYKKFGFKIQKLSKSFYLDGCDANIMELENVNQAL